MIAACPRCSARYRIDSGRLRPEGVRLRCSRCEAVFRVRPPAVETPAGVQPIPAVEEPSAPAPPPRPTVSRAPDASALGESPAADRERLVLIADPDIDRAKATGGALVDWGLQPIVVHDGVETILTIQRMLPRVVVIDAALPKMFGFQVCELVKRNESLRHIQVVLVGTVHNQGRYRRPPSDLYGADAYIEQPQLPEALHPILSGLGLPMKPLGAGHGAKPAVAAVDALQPQAHPTRGVALPDPAVDPNPSTAPPAAPIVLEAPPVPIAAPPQPPELVAEPSAPIPVTHAPAAAPVAQIADDAEEIAKAERLARIVVSDIILYNPEKFEAAVRAGNVAEAMAGELAEGRSLFAARIDAGVREHRDFLVEELVRVARERESG